MEFRVEILPRAAKDLDDLYEWVAAVAPTQGPLWYNRLEQAIESLAYLPLRYPVEARLSSVNSVVRFLPFGARPNVYRIYYRIIGERVEVMDIRSARRTSPGARDLS